MATDISTVIDIVRKTQRGSFVIQHPFWRPATLRRRVSGFRLIRCLEFQHHHRHDHREYSVRECNQTIPVYCFFTHLARLVPSSPSDLLRSG